MQSKKKFDNTGNILDIALTGRAPNTNPDAEPCPHMPRPDRRTGLGDEIGMLKEEIPLHMET